MRRRQHALPSRALRALPPIIGVLLVAQVASVATAATTGERVDQPRTTPSAAIAATEDAPSTTAGSGQPLLSIEEGPLDVSIGIDPPDTTPPDRGLACGATDRLETGLQGDVPLVDQLSGRASEGYNCGLDVIGYNALGGRGGNANLAWAGDCAFVAGDGIAVLDVSDPTDPRHVTTLRTPGSLNTLETLDAGTYGDKAILAAGRYSLFADFSLSNAGPVDLYDVSDCSNPRFLSTTQVPTGVHNLTLSADLTQLWSTLPTQALDISDPTAPKYLGNMDDALRAAGLTRLEVAHEAAISDDKTRLYLGGQVPGDEGTVIVDITDWPNRPIKILSDFSGPGHSLSQATIDGTPYLVRSDESVVPPTGTPCLPTELTPFGGVAQAFLTDTSDETDPVDRGSLTLEINKPESCANALLSGVNASSHYQDVDDPDDTTFAMVSMWNAGLRIFDLRDPAHPTEVAYFNPGQFPLVPVNFAGGSIDRIFGVVARTSLDQAWGHVRYDERTGTIWVATRTGGFWVLQLQEQLRKQLDLPAVASRTPLEGSPRPAASVDVRPPRLPESALPSGIYCTLGPISQLL